MVKTVSDCLRTMHGYSSLLQTYHAEETSSLLKGGVSR
jgi:hypothetical protein